MIKISIITPVYNAEKFIEQCILNIISQNCSQIEHIIIDGSSTDGTNDIIKKYAKDFPHIKWISEKDDGQSDAMNKGIKIAAGEYISFLNVDDTYRKDILKHWLDLIKNNNFYFYAGNCNVYNSDFTLFYTSKPKFNSFFKFYFKQSYPINPCSYFYKKAVHDSIGYYDSKEDYCMDLDFILRYMNKYKLYYYEDEVWGNFYLVESSKTFQDNTIGNTQLRKNDLFKLYWKKNNLFLRYFLIIRNKLIDNL